MGNSSVFKKYEDEAAILEKIAKEYPKNSQETEVLKKAGFALFFATISHRAEFEQFLINAVREPTAEAKEHLRKIGIEID